MLNLCEDKEYLTFRSGHSQREQLEEAYIKYGIREIRLPIPDRSAPDNEAINTAVEIASKNKTPLVVHCRGGRERSVTLLIAILASTYDLPCAEALVLIGKERKNASPRIKQLRALSVWEAKKN